MTNTDFDWQGPHTVLYGQMGIEVYSTDDYDMVIRQRDTLTGRNGTIVIPAGFAGNVAAAIARCSKGMTDRSVRETAEVEAAEATAAIKAAAR